MPHKGEILVVEDEEHIVDVVRMYLENEGYTVVHAPTGEEALRAAEQRPPTLVILDLALPRIDGIEVCKKLRAKSFVPVVMLTARDAEIDRVVGLEIGADDYVTKPFSPRELVARVKAILRRVEPAAPLGTPLAAGGVTIWPERREAAAAGESVTLTAKEFDLLLYLVENRGIVLTRAQILAGVWGYDYFGGERTVDAHVRSIRKKLGEALPLSTVRGVGYKIDHER